MPATANVTISGVGFRLESDGQALTAVAFDRRVGDPVGQDPVLPNAARQLEEYFAGSRRECTIPLRPQGTAFQLAVWKALLEIPYGETRSYLDIARAIGKPNAVRAVGAANGANPIAIIVPCHRVIGHDGSLTGYGGGLGLKQRLLALEGARQPSLFTSS